MRDQNSRTISIESDDAEHEMLSKGLSDKEISRIAVLQETIDDYYDDIPLQLNDSPNIQEKCLQLLLSAEQSLAPPVEKRENIIQAKLALTKLDMELQRSQHAQESYKKIATITYIVTIILILVAALSDLINQWDKISDVDAQIILVGIPIKIWFWSLTGSLASMLIRTAEYPFSNKAEAMRWLVTRPLVGVIMGLMMYLMLLAGLIVFTGASNNAPNLNFYWVVAFIGGFSDTLSINLLNSLIGKFKAREVSGKEGEENNLEITVNSGATEK